MTVKTEVKYDLIVPRYEAPFTQVDWKEIGGIVREELKNGIQEQRDVTGGAYPPLKPNTIASRKGKGAKRLIDTGNLLESPYPTATASQVEVRLGPQRAKIGQYHQEGIKPHKITAKGRVLAFITTDGQRFAKSVQHPGTPPVPFFGISQGCATRILKYVEIQIDKWLKETK